MGCAIAGWLSICGAEVLMFDETEFTRRRAVQNLNGTISEYVSQGLLTLESGEKAKNSVKAVSTLEEVTNVDMVVEAVPDDLEIKKQLFLKMDAVAPPHTILTTNSINFDITWMAPPKPSHSCCGVRFLYPVYFVPIVETAFGWRSHLEDSESRAPSLARATSLLSSLDLSTFLPVNPNFRRLLNPIEIENYLSHQRRKVSESLGDAAGESGGLKYATDGDVTVSKLGLLKCKQGECGICFEELDMYLLLPCGHSGLCRGCIRSLPHQNCLFCRVSIERVIPFVD